MFISGGSGSTAGGVKANAFSILAAYSIARLRGFSRLTIFRRTIPNEIIERDTALVVPSAKFGRNGGFSFSHHGNRRFRKLFTLKEIRRKGLL